MKGLNKFKKVVDVELLKELNQLHTRSTYQHGIRFRPDILVSIYGLVLGLNLRFQKPKKLSEGG